MFLTIWPDTTDFNGVEMQKIYVMKLSSGEIKIGVASDPAHRWQSLMTAMPRNNLDVVYVSDEMHDDMVKIERAVHRRFSDRRLNGEWFEVPVEEAIAAINEELSRGFDRRVEKEKRPYRRKEALTFKAEERKRRDALIAEMVIRGGRPAHIAKMFKVSRQRISQIILAMGEGYLDSEVERLRIVAQKQQSKRKQFGPNRFSLCSSN